MLRAGHVCAPMFCLLGGGMASAELVINECLFDPAGPDAGAEFVELFNPGPDVVDLTDVRLQFANGADGVWQTRWTGGDEDRLAPGARYLLADLGWTGAAVPDTTVRLALQNGPDAVRLVRGDQPLDLLGYGDMARVELFESAPAEPVTGLALARRPDGRDTDDNAHDFVAAAPTPGAVNFRRWSLVLAGLSSEPPSLPVPGGEFAFAALLHNDGWDAWPPGNLRCRTGQETREVAWSGCAVDGETTVSWTARPPTEGRVGVVIETDLPGDTEVLTLDAGAVQVGPGLLVVSEVMAAPDEGQGEWIEFAAVSSCNLADYLVRDADGDWRRLPAAALVAGAHVVVAADRDALLRRESMRVRPGVCSPDDLQVMGLTRWPSLNNAAPDGRSWADRVLLADSTGLVVDHVTLGGPDGAAPAGRSWERVALRPLAPSGANWSTSTAPDGGTPGCPNSLSVPGGVSA